MRRWVVVLAVALGGCTKESPPAAAIAPTEGKAEDPEVAVVRVHLDANGAVLLNGVAVKPEELSGKLRAMRAQTPSVEVHVDAADGVPYPKVIEALDAAHQAGIIDISFDSPPPKPVEAPQQH